MEGTRKQAISLRVGATDLRKVKKLAQRLGVRDSDVIRFAVKTMLARVAPLCDHGVRGRALLPAFIEAGRDLCRHFDLDAARLEEIINDGVAKDQEVESDDLQLIAMAGIQHIYGQLTLSKVPPGLTTERRALHAEDPLSGQLRGYLYSKYADTVPPSDVTTK
jgi:DNA-binding MltR family transcriptional regulator